MLKNNLNAAAANIPPLLTLCYQTAYVICMQLYMLEHTVLVTAPSYGYNLVLKKRGGGGGGRCIAAAACTYYRSRSQQHAHTIVLGLS
jgi:hypothetical protein